MDDTEHSRDKAEYPANDGKSIRPIKVSLFVTSVDCHTNQDKEHCSERKSTEYFDEESLAVAEVMNKHVNKYGDAGSYEKDQSNRYHGLGSLQGIINMVRVV